MDFISRYVWYLVHILTLTFTTILIKHTWEKFMDNPTVTTLDSFSYDLKEVPMPGISVCNVNKISKSRAQKYARELSGKSGEPVEEIFNNISLLGRLYEYSLPTSSSDSPINFQNFLDKYDSGIEGFFNTYKVLKEISTPCSELLTKCQWQEEDIECHELFVSELTAEGHCCVFNYLFQKNEDNIPEIIKSNDYQAMKFGMYGHLTFIVTANISDFYYTTLNTEASAKRDCIFRDELSTVFGDYSYSDCIMDCKIRSIEAMCGCIPFNYMSIFRGKFCDQCTLADLPCLNRHAIKWKMMYPVDYHGNVLEREKQNSILCRKCYPACMDTLYGISSDSIDILDNGTQVRNFSVVHVLMEKPVGSLNKQDVYFYWYDIIGLFGGICSLTMGLNFISLLEMIYFFLCIFEKKNIEKNRRHQNVEPFEEVREMSQEAE
ncbi:sodium channel protein Nach isoform X3 [Leptinotarsa decemlineata]|uniref:sodium channel protein Nach isoform X3 n=1 Tax=Leptinotarsa decemlineata TaxID=7539 RepID=UPI003D309FA3